MSPRHVLRQATPRLLAIFTWVVCGVLVASSLLHAPDPGLLALLAGVAGVAWALLWRPAVVLDATGVTLANVVRDTHIPWPLVDATDRRWNLRVFAGDGREYTSWAIASSPSRGGRVVAPHVAAMFPGGHRAWQAADVSPQTHVERAGGGSGWAGLDAGSVAALVEGTRDEYDEAVASDDVIAVTGGVTRRLAAAPVAVLLASLALAALAWVL